ncbi:hypothetical protein CC86DRAFT_342330 [Ophiobolus disseminans]|uniref:Uncharacterized protein n=1 Tax=Ophiobolus disseminans TaxID=1469910 RepID=A0A6A7AFN1_9PLEO|nr:hypothetical protein CC86DRAFT_342330 [Ophiobolus disseminans]
MGNPANPISNQGGNRVDPTLEGIDEDVDEAQRTLIEENPYHRYQLKTGKHRGHTLKHVNDVQDLGYLGWMLGKPKACRDVDDSHIVKKGLLQWKGLTDRPAPDSAAASTPTVGQDTSNTTTPAATSRFQDAAGNPIWIDGFDIIALFHMTEQQLKRRGVRPIYSNRFNRQYRSKRYLLEKVYAAAVVNANCPIDETPDQALDRYLAKLQKCGRGLLICLPSYCECGDCEDIRCGPTKAGYTFRMKMLKATAEERQRRHDQIEDNYIWAMNH